MGNHKPHPGALLRAVLLWGSLWGAFEATVGHVLHLLPIPLGAYVWFPIAFFFMDGVYRHTLSKRAVMLTALLAAGIKLTNLFTPIRPDYVINPALSMLLESLAMTGALYLLGRKREGGLSWQALRILGVNTAWRLLYCAYLALLAPAWIRDASVLSNPQLLSSFLLMENLLSFCVCLAVAAISHALREIRLRRPSSAIPTRGPSLVTGGLLLALSVALQFIR